MKPEVLALEELTVVGYGAQKKVSKDLPEARENVSAAEYSVQSKLRAEKSESRKARTRILDSPPAPVNGFDRFNEYIRNNTVFPVTNKDISSTFVILNFLVRTDGKPDSIIVVKSQGDEFSAEGIRLLKEGPSWIPAIRDGKKVVEATRVKIVLKSNQ